MHPNQTAYKEKIIASILGNDLLQDKEKLISALPHIISPEMYRDYENILNSNQFASEKYRLLISAFANATSAMAQQGGQLKRC